MELTPTDHPEWPGLLVKSADAWWGTGSRPDVGVKESYQKAVEAFRAAGRPSGPRKRC
jgi:hypothetical protein